MPFPGWGMATLHKNTQDRLDKLCFAKAVPQLKTLGPSFISVEVTLTLM